MTSARVTGGGFASGDAAPSWGRFGREPDPLVASAREFVGSRNQRLSRLDRPTLAALVAAHLALERGAAPASLVVSVEDGCAAADRAFWATARERGGADASPTLFAATLPSAVAGELAMTFALRGPCIVVAGAGAADVPPVPTAAGDDGPCLRVRLRGWSGAQDGEAFAVLARADGRVPQPPAPPRRRWLPSRPMTPPAPPTNHDALRAELVALICDATRRDPVDPSSVSDTTPCVGGALLADSLDVLEIVVAIDRVYGVSLRDGEIGRAVFADMGSLTRFVASHRVR